MTAPAPAVAARPRASHSLAGGAARVYVGDCVEVLPSLGLEGAVDCIVADPPYFLSAGGISCKGGRQVPVDKGAWDRPVSPEQTHAFHLAWLAACQPLLAPHGTLFVSGTLHSIYSIGYAMEELGYKLLNDITWEKPNPPPNLSCRRFVHATETVLWAAPGPSSRHRFHYDRMRDLNGGKQMKSVWRIGAAPRSERAEGAHPTQKPLALVERMLLATTDEGSLVLDPFLGSGTTAVAAVRLGRRCVGVERDRAYARLAAARIRAPLLQAP